MRIRLLIAICLIAQPLWATTGYESYGCAFQNTVVFGASISSRYSSIGSALKGIAHAKLGKHYYGKEKSPIDLLVDVTQDPRLPKPQVHMKSEIVADLPFSQHGDLQFMDLLSSGEKYQILENATAITFLEGFYWPLADQKCDRAMNNLEEIVNWAARNEKALIIGTVPEENPDYVGVTPEGKVTMTGKLVRSAWYPPNPSCVLLFNHKLKHICRGKNQCYISDLHETVRALNNEGIDFEDKINYWYDFRFDGVHLSPIAIRYVASELLDQLELNPPRCSQQ